MHFFNFERFFARISIVPKNSNMTLLRGDNFCFPWIDHREYRKINDENIEKSMM